MRSPDAGPRAVRRRLLLSTFLIPVVMAGTLDARAPRAASAARTLSASWKQVRSAHFVLAGNGSDNELRQAATEMESFRQVLQQMFPSLRLTSPIPTNEGVPDYYSTFRLDPATGLRIVGTPPASRLSWLRRSALLPLETMLSSHGAVRLLQDQQDRATFYAESAVGFGSFQKVDRAI